MYGFIRVGAVNSDTRVADCKYNADKIIEKAAEAEKENVSVLVYSELTVSGYTCGDLFNQIALVSACEREIGRICTETAHTHVLMFVGMPVRFEGRLYNCAAVLCSGKLLGLVPKSFIPEYSEYYETRLFTAAFKGVRKIFYSGFDVPFGTDLIFREKNNPDFTVAVEICEDLWVPISPSARHAMAGANIIVNLSCSDETVGKAEYRRDLVKMQSAKLMCGYVYCDANYGESSTDMTMAGHNIICENGIILAEGELFKKADVFSEVDVEMLASERQMKSSSFFSGDDDGYVFVEFECPVKDITLTRVFPRLPFVPQNKDTLNERAETILNIQSKGLEKRISHTCSKSLVIGISGGLDSALALLVACRTIDSIGIGRENIICVTMPCFGTTERTLNNAEKLVASLGCSLKKIDISDEVRLHLRDIGHEEGNHDVTYENAQARVRTLILMDLANEKGGIVVGTGDMSELALGWCTYCGDHMSMYAVNSSVPKTLVKYLVSHEADRMGGAVGVALQDILSTEISPELLPPENGNISQKTEDIIGPYELHDFFLYYCVRRAFSPDKILYLAKLAFDGEYDEMTIRKWLKVFYARFFSQQFKRSCMPDGVKVGSVSLSPRADWRMPSDALPDEWLKKIDG